LLKDDLEFQAEDGFNLKVPPGMGYFGPESENEYGKKKTPRKFIIGGNWKSNCKMDEIKKLIKDTLNKMKFEDTLIEVVVAPTSLHIPVEKELVNDNIKVACQNVSKTGKGAFTGEVTCG